mgnify:CR=1 FL=1
MMLQLALKTVTKQINQWDPERLLEGGAPDDEYEYEIEKIAKATLESQDQIELAQAMEDTFYIAFRRKYDYDECYKIAKQIWQELYE